MAENAEFVAYLRDLAERWSVTTDPLSGNETVSEAFSKAADALEVSDAKIAELTEIVESVRHIQALKTFVNAKVKKLQALNRRLR